MTFTEPVEFSEALRQARERGLLPTTLSSDQLGELDAQLRRLSVFSARTNHAGYLQRIKDLVEKLLTGSTNEATARAELQDAADALGYDPQRGGFPDLADPNIPPAEPGSLRDLSSDQRTQLVLRTQMRQMANRGYQEQGSTPAALFAFPAWELIRIYPREKPRGDWQDRWRAAGGTFYGGSRMIAPKGAPEWADIGSRALFKDAIGTDHPPFAFGSGMGWRQVPRQECARLGVPVDKAKAATPAPLDDAEIAADFDPEFLRQLRADLDAEIAEGKARLTP